MSNNKVYNLRIIKYKDKTTLYILNSYERRTINQSGSQRIVIMTNKNEHLYLNIYYIPVKKQFDYDVDNIHWCDVLNYGHLPYFQTSDKYKLKIWLDLNGLKLDKRIKLTTSNSLRSYSLIKK